MPTDRPLTHRYGRASVSASRLVVLLLAAVVVFLVAMALLEAL